MNTNVGPQYKLTFAYDPKGRRIQKAVLTNNGTAYIGQYTNNLLYDGWNLVAELRNPNSPLRTYMWGSDLSGSMQGAGGVGGLLEVTYCGASTTNCFPAFDGNGNVAALVNAADGTEVADYEYGPFGEVIRATGPIAKANPIRFATKYQDDETDLSYYPYRYLNASIGRWLSRDPASEIGAEIRFEFSDNDVTDEDPDLNAYSFVFNNPLTLIDRFGLAATDGSKTKDKTPACPCKCKALTISYTPKLKNGNPVFQFYNGPPKLYGFTIHLRWIVDGDGSMCSYGVYEPAGGVTGSNPAGTVNPSSGTVPFWGLVRQKYDDHLGIPDKGKGSYSINVNLTQTYGCWDAGVDPQAQPPTMTWGPYSYTGSSTTKK